MIEGDAPRGFSRKYFDLEPELSDWLTAEAKRVGKSMRVYVRDLIVKAKQEQESQRGSKVKK